MTENMSPFDSNFCYYVIKKSNKILFNKFTDMGLKFYIYFKISLVC